MLTPQNIIELLGGKAAVARALGFPGGDVGAKRVRAWSMRSTIPPTYWLQLVGLAESRAVPLTIEQIAMAHAPRPQGDSRADPAPAAA